MLKRFGNRPFLFVLLGLGLGLLVGVGMMVGTLTALTHQPVVSLTPPPTLLHATGSHSGESMALATGQIDEDVEGLFVLDYLTGDLQCYVMNPRTFTWGGVFKYNVVRDLGIEQGKKPNYAMVTGAVVFQRGAAARQTPALCAVYVADANTGNFAAYGLGWDRTAARGGVPQQGTLSLLGVGKARTLEIRE
ncbi:MAG: hypothetical protein KJ000_34235 [Pirellulaceae bacterium]|nr:hypothetical protein [Pirellulaceae bacterium]